MGKKTKQKLSNALRLNFYDLKTIHFFHPCYHQKIIEDIFKNVQKTSVSHISPYSVQMRENTDQRKLRIGTYFTQCVLMR